MCPNTSLVMNALSKRLLCYIVVLIGSLGWSAIAQAGICEDYIPTVPVATGDIVTVLTESSTDPSWSADGSRLIFQIKNSASGASAICLYEKASGAISTLSYLSSAASTYGFSQPVFFPGSSSRFIYVKEDGSGPQQLLIYEIGKSDSEQSEAYIDYGATVSSCRFSPDGTKLAYARDGKIVVIGFTNTSSYTKTLYSPMTDQTLSQPVIDNAGAVYAIASKDGLANSLVKLTSTGQTAIVTTGIDHLTALVSESSAGKTLIYDVGSATYVKASATAAVVGASTIYQVSVDGGTPTVLAAPTSVAKYAYSNYGGTLIHQNGVTYLVYAACSLQAKDDNGTAICDDSNENIAWRLMLLNLERLTSDILWIGEDYIAPSMSVGLESLIGLTLSPTIAFATLSDTDSDGSTIDADCDDADAATYPGAAEVVDWYDNDCDGGVDEDTTYSDDDGDGYCEGEYGHCAVAGVLINDCNDADPTVSPGSPEIADDHVDNDCDGAIDEDSPPVVSAGSADADDDGDGYTENTGDCDDTDNTIYNTAPEKCDTIGIDNDCDGNASEFPETADCDGDQWSVTDGDCTDTEATIHPGATESANGIDDDCDGEIDEGITVTTPPSEPENEPAADDSDSGDDIGDNTIEAESSDTCPSDDAAYADADDDGFCAATDFSTICYPDPCQGFGDPNDSDATVVPVDTPVTPSENDTRNGGGGCSLGQPW